jgi:hypothetical protein
LSQVSVRREAFGKLASRFSIGAALAIDQPDHGFDRFISPEAAFSNEVGAALGCALPDVAGSAASR